MLFAYMLLYRSVESLNFTLFLLSLPKLTSFRFSYAILLFIITIKVYFYVLYSTEMIVFRLTSFIYWSIQQIFWCILMKNRIKIFVLNSVSITNLCFWCLVSLLFVSLVFAFFSDIDYRQFSASSVSHRYRFVFAFKQHRLPTLVVTDTSLEYLS